MRKTQTDGHRLAYHPRRVGDWLDGKTIFPLYVEIGPTNRCNHRCAFCALDWLKHGGSDIDADVLRRALVDMGRCGVKSVMFAGEGEPFLHREIVAFIQGAKAAGLDVAVTTNGALFDADKARACLPCLSWIRISLDAGAPQTYAEVHGVKAEEFDRVLKNLADAVEWRQRLNASTTIGVQVLILPQNSGGLVDIARKVKALGADNVQFKPYSHHPSSRNQFDVDHAQLAGLEKELRGLGNERFEVHYRRQTIERIEAGRTYAECHGLPFFALIDSRGDVIPCNLHYNNPEFTYGNLAATPFAELWMGEQRRRVLAKIHKQGMDVCREGCRLDAVNRYLAELKSPHPHVNFI